MFVMFVIAGWQFVFLWAKVGCVPAAYWEEVCEQSERQPNSVSFEGDLAFTLRLGSRRIQINVSGEINLANSYP